MTKLYEANNHILIHTGYDDPAMHRHGAAHIILSLGGEMCITLEGAAFPCHGVMIPSGVSHRVDTKGNAALVFLYDCTTEVANQIRSVCCISEECCQTIGAAYADFAQACTADNYSRFEKVVLAQLGFTGGTSCVKDERIQSAMQYIRSSLSENITCQEAADTVNLSQSRFSHLFKEQVGVTFAAYLIYQRIMYVYLQILQGMAITEAALEAGFSSCSHFADVNRRVFGLTASAITHDLIFIKVQ